MASTDHTQRRYLWTARAFSILGSASVCCNIILIMVLLNMHSRVEPYFITMKPKAEQVFEFERFNPDLRDENIQNLVKNLVKQYVIYRNTIVNDPKEMARRWGVEGKIYTLSDQKMWQIFSKENEQIFVQIGSKDKPLDFTRTIEIDKIDLAEGDSNKGTTKWNIEATVDNMRQNGTPVVNKKKITLTVMFDPQSAENEMTYQERLKNPFRL